MRRFRTRIRGRRRRHYRGGRYVKDTPLQENLRNLRDKQQQKVSILGIGISKILSNYIDNDFGDTTEELVGIIAFANEVFVPAVEALKKRENELEESYLSKTKKKKNNSSSKKKVNKISNIKEKQK